MCNGSTPDSDSVCGGSNPSSPAKPLWTVLSAAVFCVSNFQFCSVSDGASETATTERAAVNAGSYPLWPFLPFQPATMSLVGCRKRWGRKGALGYVWCFLHLSLGKSQCFSLAFHSEVTVRASDYAPPDTEVSNLQLVASERLPSIEGAVEIQMDIPFLRGRL